MVSSWVCWRLSATWAAMTRCLSAISVHWAQLQSLHLQNLLWPFNHETTPWFRHRAHFGTRGCFRSAKDCCITNDVSAMAFNAHLKISWSWRAVVAQCTRLWVSKYLLTRPSWMTGPFCSIYTFTFTKFKSLCLQAPRLVQRPNSLSMPCQLFFRRVNNYTRS